MIRLKVWSNDRVEKFAVHFSDEDDVQDIIGKGSKKLNINGVQLVAEEDGTIVDDNVDLLYYAQQSKPVLLLRQGEIWTSENVLISLPLLSQEVTSLNSELSENNSKISNATAEGNLKNIQNDEDVTNDTDEMEQDQVIEESSVVQQVPVSENSVEVYLQQKRAAFQSFDEYIVPWTQMGPTDLSKCLSGTADDEVKSRMVQAVINDMRFYNTPITMKDLRRVAVQFMSTFPSTFEDKQDNGSRLDTGCHGI